MKNIFKSLALMLTTAVFMTACTERDLQTDPVENVASVNALTLSVIPNESGSVQAFIGDEISARGINLENVSSVEFYHSGTTTTAEAKITKLDHENISFVIPYFEFAQSDYPYGVSLYIYDKNVGDIDGDGVVDPIFSYGYFISVPITDVVIDTVEPVSVTEGTVGDNVTIKGRNLGQVSEVTFAGISIAAENFVDHLAEAITFTIPAGSYDEGTSTVAISATWNGGDVVSVTEEFAMKTPKFDAYTGKTPLLNEYVTLTGENLDLVSGYTWDGFELSVYLAEDAEPTSTEVTLYVPAVMDNDHTGEMQKDIVAVYGEPAQDITVAKDFTIDATKLAIESPEITAVSVEDGGDDASALRYYLGKTVTLTGTNLNAIKSVKVGDQSATLVGTPTGVECQFTVPDTFDFTTFTEATKMEIEVTYGDENDSFILTEKPEITVYPMYFYTDITMYPGCSSKSYYTKDAYNSAFFMPNDGATITPAEWVLTDPYAVTDGGNPVIAGAKKVNGSKITMDEYYKVPPTMTLYFDSAGSKLSFGSVANSTSMIKCHRYWNFDEDEADDALPGTYGTNVMYFTRLTSGSDDEVAIKAGDFTKFDVSKTGSSACPAYNMGATSGSNWEIGSVIVVMNECYTSAITSDKPNSLDDTRNVGYIVVKEVTCIADTTVSGQGKRTEDLSGHVKFDFYWSPVRNAGN